MIIINRSSKDNATLQEWKDTQKTPNALLLNRSVFLYLHLPFHIAFA